MVGLFVVIVVVRRLRPGAPQPPDGVARRHQPRETVTSHDALRAHSHDNDQQVRDNDTAASAHRATGQG